jgi:hypothetical protein
VRRVLTQAFANGTNARRYLLPVTLWAYHFIALFLPQPPFA